MSTPPPSPESCNCAAFRKAARHVSQLYDRALAPFGITVTQFSILGRLRNQGPRTINELAAEMATDRTTTGRNLRPLERDGLITITRDGADGRRRALALTPDGRDRLRDAVAGWRAAQTEFEAKAGAALAGDLRDKLAAVLALDLSAKP